MKSAIPKVRWDVSSALVSLTSSFKEERKDAQVQRSSIEGRVVRQSLVSERWDPEQGSTFLESPGT